MKNEVIIVRVRKTFKEKLEKAASASKVTVSEYVREIIQTAINNKTKV